MSKRLVFVAGGVGLGGSERQLYLALKHLPQSEFQPHLIYLNPDQNYFAPVLKELGVTIHSLPEECQSGRARMQYLHRLIGELRPEILHSWIFHTNPYAGIIGRLRRTPLIIGSQRNTYESVQRRLARSLRLLSLYSVPHMVVNSAQAKQELTERRYPANRILFLPNSVELPVEGEKRPFPPDLLARIIDPRKPLIGIVGNLRRQKNHALFVQAMAQVIEACPEAQAVIVGRTLDNEPEVEPTVRHLISELGLQDNVHILGQRHDVPAVMQHLTIFCLTSTFEGTPNVVLEAMAASRAVVATEVGGVPQLIKHERTGMLVKSGDESAVADAILHLLKHPQKREKIGRAANKFIQQSFSAESLAQQLATFYNSHT